MKDLTTVPYYEITEKVVDILCKKTQSNNPLFFRIMVSYYLTKVASMMRATIKTKERGRIPINIYAINLGESGVGKGHSTNIVEEQILDAFRERFLNETFPVISDKNLSKIANKRAIKKAEDPEEELLRVEKEFNNAGKLAFSFDSATTAAVKQMRHKLLMANAGSMNMEIDEIGSNLLGNVEVLTTFLELFDIGKVKQKLTKNTSENLRSEEIEGRTPTNMMWFGTPTKLFDGARVEEAFYTMLDTGYARRCLFGYADKLYSEIQLTPEQVYDMMTDSSSDMYLKRLSNKLRNLADLVNFDLTIEVPKDVTLMSIEYKLDCEKRSKDFGEHESIKKAEMNHRYFKALKLAGTYAFIDGTSEVTEDQLYSAMKLTEASGDAFNKILTRERNYAKLAKYLAESNQVTHADLVEDLPFYNVAESKKRELMELAIAWGYRNNIIIKKTMMDNIELIKGEALVETDLDKIIISYSNQLADGYLNEEIKFKDLPTLTQTNGYHWTSHHLIDGYRNEDNCIPGFNLIVLDIDEGVDIPTVITLMKDFTYLIYTTKRHTDTAHRFRMILPMSHILKLQELDYKKFMTNIYEWLPFEPDTQTNQRSRKWTTHNGAQYSNRGELIDALMFIPETVKNANRKQIILDHQSLSNLERWFCTNTTDGNRSNQLIKYAYLLVDSGMELDAIKHSVLSLNSKLSDSLDEAEVLSTILVSTAKAISKR